jgi:hypothetical protein
MAGVSTYPDEFIPGKQHVAAGELVLVNESSCIMSAILDSMLNAKFPRTREYASKIACPTSCRISNHNHTHYF